MSVGVIVTFVTEIVALISAVIPFAVWMKRVANGSRCQLRSEMLKIYYHDYDNRFSAFHS